MSHVLSVHALPMHVAPSDLTETTTVVIDVLRASTTISYALMAGADKVIPCVEVEEARAIANDYLPDDVILGGERKGLRIDGFQLGNSPEEYAAARMKDKVLIFTTTNGTRAMNHAQQAKQVLIGAFVNASAIFREIVGRKKIHLLCAGTNGQISEDDLFFAGMLVDRICSQSDISYLLNDQATSARRNWLRKFGPANTPDTEPVEPERLAAQLQNSLGGQNLVRVGLEHDILCAAQIDLFDRVPVLNVRRWQIRLL